MSQSPQPIQITTIERPETFWRDAPIGFLMDGDAPIVLVFTFGLGVLLLRLLPSVIWNTSLMTFGVFMGIWLVLWIWDRISTAWTNFKWDMENR